MSTPTYCDEDDVYHETGLSSAFMTSYSGLNTAAVTALINGYIVTMEKKINNLLGIPHVLHREHHKGTGETDEWDLGSEDEEGFFSDYNAEDNVTAGYAAYFGSIRMKLPYPKTGDQTEDLALSCFPSNCTLEDDDDVGDFTAGSNSLHATFSAAGYFRYPSSADLNKNIDIFEFLSFRVRCSSSTVKLTLRLYDLAGNYNYKEFYVDKANVWYIKNFDLDEDFTGNIDWDDDPLYYWELHVDGACQVWLDNLNFNDEWFLTIPQGKFVVAHKETDEPPDDGFPFYVTYGLNPFLSDVPDDISKATAKLAGIELLNYCIGIRQRDTAFLIEGSTMIPVPDKETLYGARTKLQQEADGLLSAYGYGWEFRPVEA
jgi:hypothetical protein